MERRFSGARVAPVEVRAEGDARYISGYAAVFYDPRRDGTEYELLPDVVERIMPGAFDEALTRNDEVVGLFNHDMDNLLGRNTAGTLELSVDRTGLRYDIRVDRDDPDHQRVLRKIQRGDLKGSSFAFYVERQSWQEVDTEDESMLVRQIEQVGLIDVGPVTRPAYEATSTGLRAVGDLEEARAAVEAYRDEVRAVQARANVMAKRARVVELGL